MTEVDIFKKLIRQRYGCRATYLKSENPGGTHQGVMDWSGTVHIFTTNHSCAYYCYGWSIRKENEEKEYVTIPGTNSVDSAIAAVHKCLS